MKIFKKKIFGAIIAMSLVLMMGFQAVAADSPSTDGIVTEALQAVDKNGRSVEIDVQSLPEEYKHLAEEIKDVFALKAVLGSAYVDGMEVIDVRDVVIVGDTSLVEFPLTITFKVPGVLSTTKVAVLHYADGAWQVEPSKAGNGTITATFDSLSPVAFVVDKNTSSSAVTSPETGENTAVPAVGAVVIVAVLGAAVLRKKAFVK
ncbi:MAG: hypothetical protein ACLUEC_00770 [Coprococcus sp.]